MQCIFFFISLLCLQSLHKLICKHISNHTVLSILHALVFSVSLSSSLTYTHTHKNTQAYNSHHSKTQGMVTFLLSGMLSAPEKTMLKYWHSESRKKPKARERAPNQRDRNEMISWSTDSRGKKKNVSVNN